MTWLADTLAGLLGLVVLGVVLWLIQAMGV